MSVVFCVWLTVDIYEIKNKTKKLIWLRFKKMCGNKRNCREKKGHTWSIKLKTKKDCWSKLINNYIILDLIIGRNEMKQIRRKTNYHEFICCQSHLNCNLYFKKKKQNCLFRYVHKMILIFFFTRNLVQFLFHYWPGSFFFENLFIWFWFWFCFLFFSFFICLFWLLVLNIW